jgi:hypothetical protein
MLREIFRRHSYIFTMSFLFVLVFIGGLINVKAATAYGVNTANQLVRFDSSSPAAVTTIGTITGLQAGETIAAIDFRPATGQLYGLAAPNRLYTINTSTAVATFAAALSSFPVSSGSLNYGFDFNPTVDRLRLVTDTDFNGRINPADGVTTTDTTLAFATGDANAGQNPNVVAAGYTNSFAGATATTLYDIDSNLDILATQNPPNNGTLNTVGSLGVNVTSEAGFDIQPGSNAALAALQVNGETASKLYSINLSNGAATLIGAIGSATPLRGFAIRSGSAASGRTALDYDGDGRADYAVFRLSSGTQFVNRSSNNTFYSFPFGIATDIQTPGDYDGDGRADTAVWRPSNGTFYVLRSSDGAVQFYQFGLNGDEPVARDYDGDGKTDFAVVRRTGGQMVWYINNSANNSFRVDTFGIDNDITAPGDYDGDGKFDLGTFRNGTFYLLRSTLGFSVVQWGQAGDLIAPGDYDGDGKTDFAAVRQGTSYTWFILRSSDGGYWSPQLGSKPDFLAQADYDGDGKTDVAVWRSQNGAFYSLRSVTATTATYVFGQNGDYPIANYDTH